MYSIFHDEEIYSHLWFGNTPLNICLVARAQTSHEDTLGASTGRHAGAGRRGVEQGQHHGHDLGLHLAHAGEDVGVDRVGDGEAAVGLGLQLEQLVLAVVDGAAHVAVLPARVVHGREGLELGADGVVGPGLLGQAEVARAAGGDQLARHLGQGIVDLFAHLRAHAWEPQEVAIEDAPGVRVELNDGAEQAAALELPKAAADDAEDEEEEDDVPESLSIVNIMRQLS